MAEAEAPKPAGTAKVAKPSFVDRVSRPIIHLDKGERIRSAVVAVLLAFVIIVLPSMLSAYWTDVATSVVIYTIVALGLGLLMGRVGLVSLGQIALLALGAWVGA